MTDAKISVLITALDKSLAEAILHSPQLWSVEYLDTEQDFEDNIDRLLAMDFGLVLCGDQFGTSFMNEFAQVMRQHGTELPIYSVNVDSTDFQSVVFVKNGFTDAFRWPTDQSILIEKVAELAKSRSGDRVFKSVFVSDLDANSEIPFETFVHLPLNKKYIRYSGKDSALGTSRLARLQEKDFGKLYIDKSHANDFYSYVAQRLSLAGRQDGLSQTEQREKVTQSVRGIFAEIFDQSEEGSFESGKSLLSDAQKIVSQYVTKGKSSNWYAQMVMALGDGLNSYDHASTVSTLCTLIGIGVSHSSPEDLAIAGFFHDLGRASLPEEIVRGSMDDLTAGELEIYRKHPSESVNLLKARRVIISPVVEKAILQHHERFDGKGFPKELKGNRVSEEAQLLSFADQFSYLTIDQEGKERLAPGEAFEKISANGSIGPHLISRLRPLFARETSN